VKILSPHEAQTVLDRAYEAGYFNVPGEHKDCYPGHGCYDEVGEKKKAFRNLLGFWPDEKLVDYLTGSWYSKTDEAPRLRLGEKHPLSRRGPDSRERSEAYPVLVGLLWDAGYRAAGAPVVDWTEVGEPPRAANKKTVHRARVRR
jgi:hypothetical protein